MGLMVALGEVSEEPHLPVLVERVLDEVCFVEQSVFAVVGQERLVSVSKLILMVFFV